MSNALKSGSIDFGDLKSGGSSAAFGNSPGYEQMSQKQKDASSPRTPEKKSENKDMNKAKQQ